METYSNFKELTLSKDGASHCLYFLNVVYTDPAFTSAEDAEDPMVFMKLDIKNAFGSLCARLVLDVLSGKTSRDYSCVIKVDETFEREVHELRVYFGFFKLARACEPNSWQRALSPRVACMNGTNIFFSLTLAFSTWPMISPLRCSR
jgi:hypothetical protein